MIAVNVFSKKIDTGYEVVVQFQGSINTIVQVATVDEAIKAVKALAESFGDLRELENNIRRL